MPLFVHLDPLRNHLNYNVLGHSQKGEALPGKTDDFLLGERIQL